MSKAKVKTPGMEDFASSIREKKFNPVYLFYGEEDLLIDEVVGLILDHAIEETTKSFNLDTVHGCDVSGEDIVRMASSFPMMGEKRVVVVREFEKTVNRDVLLPYIEHPSPSTVLVLIATKPDFRNKVFKALKDLARVGEFRQLYENEIPAWVGKRVQRMGKTILPEAA